MAALVLCDGFDKYGPTANFNVAAAIIGEWTVLGTIPGIVAGLSATGYALSAATNPNMSANLLTPLTRVAGSVRFQWISGATATGLSWTFRNGATAAFTLTIAGTTGALEIRTGAAGGTLIATGAGVAAGTTHVLSWDVTVGASGAYTLRLDGGSPLSGTGNTANGQASANNLLFATGASISWAMDDLCVFDPAHAAYNSAVLTSNPVVETQFPSSDAQTQLTNNGNIMVPAGLPANGVYRTTTGQSLAANTIYFVKIIPAVNCTLQLISIIPSVTAGSAKIKGALYSDNAGAPGSRLSDGIEVIGLTANVIANLSLVTPQALVAGTPYWMAFYSDTTATFYRVDSTTFGQTKANTYASGAPAGPMSGLTANVATYQIWAFATGAAGNFATVFQNPPSGGGAELYGASVGLEDLYGFPALTTNPSTIFGVAVKGFVLKSDSGLRTVSFNAKSGSIDNTGSAPSQGLATTQQWQGSYFDVDPATGLTWTLSGVNSAKGGVSVAA
jgi:hypothetical protein